MTTPQQGNLILCHCDDFTADGACGNATVDLAHYSCRTKPPSLTRSGIRFPFHRARIASSTTRSLAKRRNGASGRP